MGEKSSHTAAYIWSLADMLRGEFGRSQIGRIILPFVLLRRLECVLEESKEAVLAENENIKKTDLPGETKVKFLLRATNGLSFYNTSKMDLSKLGDSGVKENLRCYIEHFSNDVREIFDCFRFHESIEQLSNANLLYLIVHNVRHIDLSSKYISNYEMGNIFEDLVRIYAEFNSETAGEFYAPSEIIRLTTALVFSKDKDTLTKPGIIRSTYDPTARSGGFLSASMDYMHDLNPQGNLQVYGQERNGEVYAICKAVMLINGRDITNIKHDDALTNDRFITEFDYMLSTPPFGAEWKRIEHLVKDEHNREGFNGRFGPGLPRISDSSLLFILHLISKLKDKAKGGSRIGVIVNRSPLSTGDAGSGESEIRRYLIEQDLLETIVALPNSMFYNTGIPTYILVLTNRKTHDRKNKVQLIDARDMGLRMRKSIGAKRYQLDDEAIEQILNVYACDDDEHSNIVNSKSFGYRKVKLIVDNKNTDYEKVPFGENIEKYLEKHLDGVHEHYQADKACMDEKDGLTGIVGYDFLTGFQENIKTGKQFRVYFEEVKSDDDWLFCMTRSGHNVTFRTEVARHKQIRGGAYYFKVKNPVAFDKDYLACFFSSEKWKEWLAVYNTNATLIHLNKYELLRKHISFPDTESQRQAAELLQGIKDWRGKLQELESDVWNNNSDSRVLDKYRLPINKDLQERIIEIAPYPFANIIHHYINLHSEDYKTRYELLLKLFECLGVFLVSVLIGYIDDEKGEIFSRDFLATQKKYLKYAAFGAWYKILIKLFGEIKEAECDDRVPSFVNSLNDDILECFKQAVNIRNETTGHGSHPTKFAARKTLQKVELLHDKFMEAFYDIFDRYTLIRPISTTWDGDGYNYQAEEFRGLGCYPFSLKEVKTEEPLIDRELYLVSGKNNNIKIKLYPFIRLIDIEKDSGLEAFYFYSKIIEEFERETTSAPKEFLYISHQQINRQNQVYSDERISSIFA